ncbi:MAG: ribosome-recycling factor [Microcystis aeruginosa Ma_SC_T_19800800_S464]|uniref:Ribosome-recycling factor n=1 Tax=Microcystis aeruginosa Ma_SC_T_19800800_S464 TaxID=2486257 RepID=A0A552DK79_MICAE|nr:MAG: ribosome-recycling factor [Microcystis aeruginosa Ma_SC_T_19800800_S464]
MGQFRLEFAKLRLYLDFPRINILAMAKSLTEPELKQYNTNGLLETKS